MLAIVYKQEKILKFFKKRIHMIMAFEIETAFVFDGVHVMLSNFLIRIMSWY